MSRPPRATAGVLAAVFVSLLCFACEQDSTCPQLPSSVAIPHRVFVAFFDGTDQATIDAVNHGIGGNVVYQSVAHPWFGVMLPDDVCEADAVEYYEAQPPVRFASLSYIVHPN